MGNFNLLWCPLVVATSQLVKKKNGKDDLEKTRQGLGHHLAFEIMTSSLVLGGLERILFAQHMSVFSSREPELQSAKFTRA